MAGVINGPSLAVVLRWAAAGCSVRGIALDVQDASVRIALVTAIKGFTHMDQASVAEPVDLIQGLRNTIAVIKAKARAKSIRSFVNVNQNFRVSSASPANSTRSGRISSTMP